MLSALCELIRKLFGSRYIGMHVRRGHKWVETAPQPLAAYLEMAQNLSRTTGIRNVLITTGMLMATQC